MYMSHVTHMNQSCHTNEYRRLADTVCTTLRKRGCEACQKMSERVRKCQNVRSTQRVVIMAVYVGYQNSVYVGYQNSVNKAAYIGCENVSGNVRMSELRRVVTVAAYVGYRICP